MKLYVMIDFKTKKGAITIDHNDKRLTTPIEEGIWDQCETVDDVRALIYSILDEKFNMEEIEEICGGFLDVISDP